MTPDRPSPVIAIGFAPDAKFERRVFDELERLQEQGDGETRR